MGDEIIGQQLMEEYGCWPTFSKFFDKPTPLPPSCPLER